MAISNRTYAMLELAQWCKHHGIIEVREALQKASALSTGASSNEDLGMTLEQVALEPEIVSPPAPAQETKTKPRVRAKDPG